MNKDSRLKRDDYEEFLIRVYFTSEGDYLSRCIRGAYLDFSRTLHGMGELAGSEGLYKAAESQLTEALSGLQAKQRHIANFSDFDIWHREVCERLINLYKKQHFEEFYIGQAQKWINMTFKYVYTMGSKRIPDFQDLYPFCHVPLDNFLIENAGKYGFKYPYDVAWSRIVDYDKYLGYQAWFRDNFTIPPLDVEFFLWRGKDIKEHFKPNSSG